MDMKAKINFNLLALGKGLDMSTILEKKSLAIFMLVNLVKNKQI